MEFGVIICKKCNRSSGVNLQYKTKTCPYCNLKMKVIPEEIKYKNESEQDLVTIISKINQTLFENVDQVDANDYSDFGAVVLDIKENDEPEKASQETKTYYEKLEPFKRIAMKYIKKNKNKKGKIEFLSKIVIELGHEIGEFSDEELNSVYEPWPFDQSRAEFIKVLRMKGFILPAIDKFQRS